MGRGLRAAAWALVVALSAATAGLGGACVGGDDVAEPEGLCEPGENIFCRCPGGDPGTKQCNDAGDGFGECEFCRSRGEGAGGSSSGPGGPTSTTTSVNPGGQPLLRPCSGDDQCESGLCAEGYCTVECAQVSDCDYPTSECVPRGNRAICMATCKEAVDCEVFGAPPSLCGFATAIDNWSVTVCGEWGAEHVLMPPGTDCPPLEHDACSLGYKKKQVVCSEAGVCTVGCFRQADCPDATSCDSSGDRMGQCG